jgi:N-acetylglucosaminyldiphosphoundecaprenol N-acetyl-beta-D-mannosaminyltransferase
MQATSSKLTVTAVDPHAYVDIIGVRIRRLTTAEVLRDFERMVSGPVPRSVFIVNAATANLAYEDGAYRSCLNRADLVLNDGTGVRWAARWQGIRLAHNHVGTDLVPRFCRLAGPRGLRVFLLGGHPGVAERAARALAAQAPGVHIAGCHHGYVTPKDDERICGIINAANADLLLVAMGNPLQEAWIDRNLRRLHRGVAIGVGGLFDHLAGNLRRAPLWVRRGGFEWVQLLMQQPHKWRRYLLGNPRFLYRMIVSRPGSRGC